MTAPQPLVHRRILLAIVLLAAIGGVILARTANTASECGGDGWPAFAMTFASEVGGEPIGLIEWCNQHNWAIRRVTNSAPPWLDDRAATPNDPQLFDWFSAALEPVDALRAVDRRTPSVAAPRHPDATRALAIDTNLGSTHMEFSIEGIPVALERSGSVTQIWATRLDLVGRAVRSDDAIFWRPNCSDPLPAGERTRKYTCWNDEGRLIDRSGCLVRFDSPIDRFSDPACRL